MNHGLACAIFRNIHKSVWTDEDKGMAIKTVLEMETHNSISKADMLKVIKYLWDMIFEEVKDEEHDRKISR